MEWRDFKEDPPDSSLIEILCWHEKEGFFLCEYHVFGKKGEGSWIWDDDVFYGPTKWLPIPEVQNNEGI